MPRPVIAVESLGKSYRIAHQAKMYHTLRESLVEAVTAPWRRLRGSGPRESAFETFWALRDVSFEIQRGEVIGVIGRNGAGKSTLLKILSRITEPTEGQARIRGRVASLLEVGTGFHPELTGRENIFLNGSLLGMRRGEIERKFDEIVAFAEVEKFLDTPVKHYSSGMYVRLAFGVAAHLDPEVLIVDEVLAVGDAAFQKKCLGKMREVAGSGRTVLFVSHNLTTINSLCHNALWLDQGTIYRQGPAAVVVEDYLSDGNGDNQSVFDLATLDRRTYRAPELRLTKLVLNAGEPVRHGAPLNVAMEYRTFSNVDGVAFGIGFSSLEGVRVLSIDSDIPGERFTIEKGACGRICLKVSDFQLQPGRYFIDIGVRSGDNVGLDYLPAFAQVEVLPSEATPSVIIGRSGNGSVRVPAEFEHTFIKSGSHQDYVQSH